MAIDTYIAKGKTLMNKMLLHKSTTEQLTSYLRERNIITPLQEVIETEKPGEGNMNYTIRVKLNDGSLIVKQSNPYVEKYPSVSAPQERALAEAAFYKKVSTNSIVAAMMPSFIGVDEVNFINVIEDLGEANDLSFLYQSKDYLLPTNVQSLCEYLSELHVSFVIEKPNDDFSNMELRKLNNEHIFVYPFMEDNGFNLDTVQVGLQELSLKYKTSDALKVAAQVLGEQYLSNGTHLIHGDFYHGSWVNASGKLYVIDPEFGHYGAPEFDLGVMQAHFHLTGEHTSTFELVEKHYKKSAGFNQDLCDAFIGIEIMRRLIGLAQLPLKMTLQEKELLLQKACSLLKVNI